MVTYPRREFCTRGGQLLTQRERKPCFLFAERIHSPSVRTTTPQYRMANLLADGKLAEVLLEHEDLGYSADHSARVLWADFNIEATRATVTAWRAIAHAEAESQAAS